MQKSFLISSLLAAVIAVPAVAQVGGKPKVPELPVTMADAERSQLLKAALALSKNDFVRATEILTALAPETTTHVFVDYAAIPREKRAEYRQAITSAVQAWNAGLIGMVKLEFVEQVDAANLVMLFERDVANTLYGQAHLVCGDVRIDLGTHPAGSPASSGSSGPLPPVKNQPMFPTVQGGQPRMTESSRLPLGTQHSVRRYAEARIALLQPYGVSLHTADSIAHQAAQAIGEYLGLATNERPGELMGLDNHTSTIATKPSQADIELARQIQATRSKLMECAQQHLAVNLPRPVMSFAVLESDAGEILGGDSPHYTFTVKNSGDARLEITAKPNCGCTLANYDKVIPPGGSGKIEAIFNSGGFSGRITKLIDVTSNDPEKPAEVLKILATVKPVVAILPDAAPTLALKDTEPTVKEMQIQVNEKSAVQITNLVCSAPYVKAEVVADAQTENKYKLKLTVSPEAPVGRSVVTITGHTTSVRQPQFVMVAVCEKGIMITPQTIFLGNLDAKTTLPVSQIITLSRKEGAFKITQVETNDPNLETTVVPIHEGSEYQIKVAYKGGWQPGQAFRKLTVRTDYAKQPAIDVQVLAFIRAATAAAGK